MDENEFQQLLHEYGGLMARIAASYEADPALRDDLLQDIAFALWRASSTWRGEASMKTFIARVAHNRGASHVAGRMRQRGREELNEDFPDHADSPDIHARLREQSERLQHAVRRLPLAQRQTLTLALEGFTHREIADALGIGENNVDVRLHRARKQLTRWLGEVT